MLAQALDGGAHDATSVVWLGRAGVEEGERPDLLGECLERLIDKGLAGATVSDITAAAGVAKGTFYRYFRTKDDVISALQERLPALLPCIAIRQAGTR